MGIVERSLARLGIAGAILAFFWKRKLWWLIPIMLVVFILGALILLATTTGLAPFVYTLF